MANSKHDENGQKVTMLVENGTDVMVPLRVEPISNGLVVDEIVGVPSGLNHTHIKRDENYKVIGFGVSSVDGTPLPICVDANNRLLVHIV